MSNDKKETTKERLERMKRAKEEASQRTGTTDTSLVDQLTHQSTGEPNFTDLADQLQERQKQEYKGKNDGYIKDTLYIREDVYRAFNALVTRRGQKKEFVNEALSDFIIKKAREIGLDN